MGGITFPFQNKDYDKTTNEERKTTDFTAIVKIVGVNRYKVGIFRDYRYHVEVSLKGLKFGSQLLNYAIVVLKILRSA